MKNEESANPLKSYLLQSINIVSMKRLACLSTLFLLLFWPLMAQPPLFPAPAKMQTAKGTFTIGSDLQIKGNGGYADRLAARLLSALKTYARPKTVSAGVVVLALDKNLGLPDEGYILTVEPDGVRLQASSESGLFYAGEALLQLARFGKGDVRACRIDDRPRYGWRGFMLDESRHFFGKEKVKQYLDIMASLRLNVFHWHLTDEPGWRIEIKRYPKLTTEGAVGNWHDPEAPAAFYTQDEIREIVAYAAERRIMVVPEFDMPGHATAACRAYPAISGGGEGKWEHFTFHPCKDETFEFISNVLDEIVSLFPSPYIHIGGDEVHYGNQSWFTDPEIQQFIKDKNLGNETGLEQYFIRRAADIVASKGKTMIGWDEMIDAGVSPDKAVIMWWRHDRKHQLVKALENGYRVIMTPRRPFYADFVQYGGHKVGRVWGGYNTIEDIYRFPDPIIHLAKNYEDQLMGLQFSMWTERVADKKRLDFMVFPRLAAVAESAWTPAKSKECSLFMQKLPYFLQYLDTKDIYYFNPFDPESTPEPGAPEKEDVLQNG